MDLHLLLREGRTLLSCRSRCSTSLRGKCPSSGSEPFLLRSCRRRTRLCSPRLQFSPQTSTRTFYVNRYVVIREVHVCFHGLRPGAGFKDFAGREHRRSSCSSSAPWLHSARRRLCPEGPRQDLLHAVHFSEHPCLLLVKFPHVQLRPFT